MAAKEKKMRMKGIAEATGVSVATVSYVLNGKGRVSEEKQQEIWELLQRSGYRPKYYRYPIFYLSNYNSFEDQGMMRQFTDRVYGMNAFFHKEELAFRTEFIRVKDAAPVKEQLQELCRSRPGAVIVDTNLGDHCSLVCQYLESKSVPVVQIGHCSRASGYDACTVDNFAGGYEAAKHLLENGHRDIAIIRWEEDVDPASPQKFAGFTCAIQESGVSLPDRYIAHCSAHREEFYNIPSRVAIMGLAELTKPPTAVFIENSFMSPALLYPISNEEHEVPEVIRRLDMVHFEAWDLDAVEQIMVGKLAYQREKTKLLKINWEELGRMAAVRIRTRMADCDIPAGETIRIAPKLIVC